MARSAVNESEYIGELIADLDTEINEFGTSITSREIKSIFIGGGTPSLFSAKSYQLLFDQLRERLTFSPDIEVTLEANPGSSETDKFRGFRAAGINRLSIGIQSFNQTHLSALGRVHNSNEALNAARFAREAGFDNFNLDIMFGLPEQSLEQSLDDIEQAIALKPTHLSCYQLTLEPNTLFHHSPPITPDDELLWDMQEQLQKALKLSDYHQYEVSGYSKPNQQCQHNLNYWQFGDYIGIGAGAHGKLSLENGSISRNWKIKHPASYIKHDDKRGDQKLISTNQIAFEFMMNALRLNAGFELSSYLNRSGLELTSINTLLDKHQSQGLIQITNKRVVPTSLGRNMVNSMLEDYLSAEH